MGTRSLFGQIVFSAGAGVLVFVVLWSAAAGLWLYSGATLGLETEADSQARELAAALSPLVWNLDTPSIQGYLDTKAENREMVSIEVIDPGNHRWAPRLPSPSPGAPTTHRLVPIVHGGATIGTLDLVMTLGPRQRQVAQTIATLLGSLLLLFLAALASIALSWRRVTTRLGAMAKVMEEFASRGSPGRMEPGLADELGILARGFNAMADRIQANTASMEQEIRDRTERLMESEKLALVGSLVAGVAHEINTPVGNGITISSWLATRTREIRATLAAGPTSEDLTAYLADVESGLEVLQSGLDRTSNLIQSFKKIGADQIVDEKRPLNLATFLEEVVTSLQPTLKRFPHHITVSCPPDFVVENHPGALFQIVTNLVLNAHLHAFGPNQGGTISLTAGPRGPEFFLAVRDDGVGMAPEVLGRIFQPFFTTKRLEGGTGLGLSIVHNLVQSLDGTITVESSPGEGSSFLVVLPLEPGSEAG